MNSRKATVEKIVQFQRATCTGGDEKTAIAYLESEEGSLDDAVKSYQADRRAAKWDSLGGLVMPIGSAA